MKILILNIICFFAFHSVYAQPNFTSSDMPNIGDSDTIMYLNYQPITNNLDSETGNGYTWDFTSLPFSTYPNFKQFITFRTKTHNVSKPYLNATIEEYIYDGTAGDVNLMSYSNDTLYLHRLGAVVTGASFVPPLATIAFPIKFMDSSVISSNIYTGNNPKLIGERKTTVVYDGFGTLKLPNSNSYSNVFRIKKVERDSSYVSHTSLINTSYIWYKQGGQVPLFRLTHSGALNLYFVFGSKSTNTFTDIDEQKAINSIAISPNPSDGRFEIADLNSTNYNIEIYNMLGGKVHFLQAMNQINLLSAENGIYFIKFNNSNKKYIKTIIIHK